MATSSFQTTHGESHTRLYRIWNQMKQRCLNPNSPSYQNYGGRGILICREWLHYENFRDWALFNGYNDEEDLTIERIHVDGNYEPDNCEWIPKKRQAENRRNTLYVTLNGRTERLVVWCRLLGLKYDSVWKRIYKHGYSPEKALTYNLDRIRI